jgi:hypothetical protein
MANDRMYLVNKKTKHCVCIAVRFGGAWKQWTDDQADDMYQALADEVRVFWQGLGSQAWCIEYEHANDENPGPEHDWKSCLTCTGKYKIGQKEAARDEWYPEEMADDASD